MLLPCPALTQMVAHHHPARALLPSCLLQLSSCHHVIMKLPYLSSGHRASLSLDGPLLFRHRLLLPLRLLSSSCSTDNSVLNSSYTCHLPCATVSVGQISSPGIAVVEGVSQFGFGGCSKAYHPHLSSH